MERDAALDTLLDLDGVIIGGLARGHWVKSMPAGFPPQGTGRTVFAIP